MAQKLNMQSPDLADEKFAQLATLFPNAVTETLDENGRTVRAINKDILSQEIATYVVEGREERYQFTWPDKREAIRMANTPSTQCLRPCREESVDFDNTQNLYIEGDNLEVLKVLHETYLGKVKMIYIDPPYNTGNDFVYNDDFSESTEAFKERDGQKDEQGNRLFKNSDSNGRFHTDWLNMIYPRLKVARDLLSDDGVIFISIDENEVQNMRKICDEVFGEQNFISQLGWQKVYSPKNQAHFFSNDYEFILCYARYSDSFTLGLLPRTPEMNARYKNPDNDPRGDWKAGDCVGAGERKNGYYDVVSPTTGKVFNVPLGKHWVYAPDTMKRLLAENRIYFGKDGNAFPAIKQFLSDVSGRRASSLLLYQDYGHTDMAKKDLIKLFSDLEKVPFDTPKPVKLVKMLAILGSEKNDIILDFFSGSATTAHAVMKLNAEDGGHRKFIMVQLPELTDEKSEAYKAGYKNICEIGKERIRRAGVAIRNEELGKRNEADLDIGFRVLKLDSSNMKDVYYLPEEIAMGRQDLFEDNIKEDRSAEDLLFQVMPELGIELSSSIRNEELGKRNGVEVFNVGEGYLLACFDDGLDEEIITEIANRKPAYFVTRDRAFANDAMAVNMEQIFEKYSPDTVRRVI